MQGTSVTLTMAITIPTPDFFNYWKSSAISRSVLARQSKTSRFRDSPMCQVS